MQPNWPMQERVIALDYDLIAYPVGVAKDSYYIKKHFALNTLTHEATVQCTVVMNWVSSKAKVLFAGTYQECYDYIVNDIKNIQPLH